MALTFYRDMVKEFKLKVREFPGLIFKFGEEKLLQRKNL